MTLQTHLYNNDSIFETKNIVLELLLETDSDKAGPSDSDRNNTDTDTNRGYDSSAVALGSQVHMRSRPQDI